MLTHDFSCSECLMDIDRMINEGGFVDTEYKEKQLEVQPTNVETLANVASQVGDY